MLDWQVVLTGQELALAQQVLQHVRVSAGFAGMCADEGGKVGCQLYMRQHTHMLMVCSHRVYVQKPFKPDSHTLTQ